MRKKIKNQLTFAGLMLITFFMLTSFYTKDVTEANNTTNLLTVKTDNNSVKTFDLLITGKNENNKVFFKREESLKTPYKLEIETGTYSIVIHRKSRRGKVIGKVEMLVNGKVKASASAIAELTLLTVDEESNFTATGL